MNEAAAASATRTTHQHLSPAHQPKGAMTGAGPSKQPPHHVLMLSDDGSGNTNDGRLFLHLDRDLQRDFISKRYRACHPQTTTNNAAATGTADAAAKQQQTHGAVTGTVGGESGWGYPILSAYWCHVAVVKSQRVMDVAVVLVVQNHAPMMSSNNNKQVQVMVLCPRIAFSDLLAL